MALSYSSAADSMDDEQTRLSYRFAPVRQSSTSLMRVKRLQPKKNQPGHGKDEGDVSTRKVPRFCLVAEKERGERKENTA